jgi:hypothetical protein
MLTFGDDAPPIGQKEHKMDGGHPCLAIAPEPIR